ncbi:MAG: AraC family transcriptional regulator [Lachnospiraceae bacterium]|nr:AraC family transcriptional regulator [Lachnospiraceae bacterium]MDD3616726.1 AraC family transcriptional regulator [Lachnospiraceae bacterium]
MQILDQTLSPEEVKLKDLWQNNPSRKLDQPCIREDVEDIFFSALKHNSVYATLLASELDEHIFISDDLDTAFVRHMRYTPAFLHTHEFFELLYVIKGHCTNTIFDQTVIMNEGDICLIAPGVRHAVSAFSDEDIMLNILIRKSTFEESFTNLMGGDDILSDFFSRTFYQTTEIPYLLFHTGSDAQLLIYVNTAYAEFNKSKRFKRQMLNAIFSAFFIDLFRRHEQHLEVPNIRLNTRETNLIFILRYLQANFATISLKELASFFNYSERQMQRIIISATGMTFKENIQKQQMSRASDLLANSSLSISSIGEQIGYQSLNNFRKIFFQHYQMTPSQYRKREAKNPL